MTWQDFTSSISVAMSYFLDTLSDLVGFFLKYPVATFALLGGLVYLALDGILMILSGHASFSLQGRPLGSSSKVPSFGRLKAASVSSPRYRSLSFSGNRYSSVVGGSKFMRVGSSRAPKRRASK